MGRTRATTIGVPANGNSVDPTLGAVRLCEDRITLGIFLQPRDEKRSKFRDSQRTIGLARSSASIARLAGVIVTQETPSSFGGTQRMLGALSSMYDLRNIFQ